MDVTVTMEVTLAEAVDTRKAARVMRRGEANILEKVLIKV